MALQKGDIVWVKGEYSSKNEKGIQNFNHPGIVIQNDLGNNYSDTTIVCLGTSTIKNTNQKTHFIVEPKDQLLYTTMFMTEQIYTVNTSILTYRGKLNSEEFKALNNALCISLDLGDALSFFKNRPINYTEKEKDIYISNKGMYDELNYINSLLSNFSGIDSVDENELVDKYIEKQFSTLYNRENKTKQDIYKMIWYLNRMLKSPKLK